MTGEAAIRIHEDSIIKESIYGKRVRSTDVILTGIIYGCASISMLLLIGILGYTFVTVSYTHLKEGDEVQIAEEKYFWK